MLLSTKTTICCTWDSATPARKTAPTSAERYRMGLDSVPPLLGKVVAPTDQPCPGAASIVGDFL